MRFFLFLVLAMIGCSSIVSAQSVDCGKPPELSFKSQETEKIKGELEGKAQFFSRLIGNADLKGAVEAERDTIFQSADKVISAWEASYLSYLFCSSIISNPSLSVDQRMEYWRQFQQAMQPAKSGAENNSPGNCNNYGLNSGTITNNCPTINEAPAPSIKLLTPTFSQEPRKDGTFANQILIRITAMANLGVQACGDGIKDLFAGPYPAGASSTTSINAPPGCLRRRFDNAQGTWAIVVTTAAKDDKFVVTPMLLP